MIFHITTYTEWENAELEGTYTAPSLESEGFIHCSTAKQIMDTATIFFKGKNELVLLCIDENKLESECKYEYPADRNERDSGIGNSFPHIYGPINCSAVINVVDFPPNKDGSFTLPEEI